jgi:hypothetical protein
MWLQINNQCIIYGYLASLVITLLQYWHSNQNQKQIKNQDSSF